VGGGDRSGRVGWRDDSLDGDLGDECADVRGVRPTSTRTSTFETVIAIACGSLLAARAVTSTGTKRTASRPLPPPTTIRAGGIATTSACPGEPPRSRRTSRRAAPTAQRLGGSVATALGFDAPPSARRSSTPAWARSPGGLHRRTDTRRRVISASPRSTPTAPTSRRAHAELLFRRATDGSLCIRRVALT
jgi:hypothetical protein